MQPCVLKFLSPEVMASAVIGKGGAVIAAMRQSTQASIGLTEKHEFYPGTDCRVLTAQAQTEESLTEVSRQIIARVADAIQTTPSEQLGQPGAIRLGVLMPKAAVGGLIGKGGANVKALREQTGAKVSIGDPYGSGPGAEQIVTITGAQSALEHVMSEVNKHIQALNQDDWFQAWASGTYTGGGGGPRAGGGGGGGGGGGRAQGGYQEQGYGGGGGGNPFAGGGGGNPFGGGGGGFGGFGGPGGHGANGIDLMNRIGQSLPSYVVEDPRGFALSCVVPNRLVGGLIGRAGSGTKEVQGITGTKIGIREIPGDPENRSMNIAGPLANTCAAYMLMMKRYLDAEASAAGHAE